MYVLVKTDQGGGYVAAPGREKSHTHRLEEAQTFTTREKAVKNSCPGNEKPVRVLDLLHAPTE